MSDGLMNVANRDDSTSWNDLNDSFQKLYSIEDRRHREYELHKFARQFDLPVDVYSRLFQNFCHSQVIRHGGSLINLAKSTPLIAIGRLINILSKLSWISFVGIAVSLFLQLGEMWEHEEYLGWTIAARSQGEPVNGGRLFALETLQLMGSDLSGLNLQLAVLPHLDLEGGNLIYANFAEANLFNSNLSRSDLSYANLSQANLLEADLRYSSFEHANLSHSRLNQVDFSGSSLYRTDLSYSNLSRANLEQSKLLETSNLYRAVYDENTSFPEGFDLENSNAIGIFPDNDYSQYDFSHLSLAYIDLSNSNLEGAIFSDADLLETNLEGSDISGANFLDVKNLSIDQILSAINWQDAIFDLETTQMLSSYK